ncbi:elongation factor 1 alpha-like protein [Cryptococcus gattii NT-10]|nr:elongation factor 1 alpha-like protein [Cryptococcus gattii NT-10]
MSRHRFVRNLDLDDELDDGDEEVGMSAEEGAQMNRAMSVARNLLRDVTPPIPDNEIADSVWHYWFDGEKAAAWLRQDREKKGEAPPSYLEPTPLQQSRRRPNNLMLSPRPPQPQEDTQPPLTALQRLTLSRRQGSPAPPAASPSVGEKPMSKLALLAQKRREGAAAAAASETVQSESVLPQTAGRPSAPGTPPSSGAQSLSQPGKKPLSKLAQKMAAARAAREEAAAAAKASKVEKNTAEGQMEVDESSTSVFFPEDPISSLFSTPATSSKPKLGPTRPSPFFSIITSTSSQGGALGRGALRPAKDHLPPEPISANLHAPLITDVDALVKQFEQAFTEGRNKEDRIKDAGNVLLYKILSPNFLSFYFISLAKAKAAQTAKSASLPGKPRVQQVANQKSKFAVSQPNSPSTSDSKATSKSGSTSSTPRIVGKSNLSTDLEGLHLNEELDEAEREREREKFKERQVLSMKQEELIAKAKEEEEKSGKKNVSLIVVGHVDAGKSTLMGRVLYDIGELSEKEKIANERGSKKVGKGSFAFAWGLDALGDERDRGVTIDIATTHFMTPHRNFTLLDAPGHRDFIPAMISGAAQADVALLVVDGSPGEFEAGFERGGQTREHAWLVRSLGVKEIIVGVNKMDLVSWSQDRYEEIVESLKPFLLSAGFNSAKTTFLPLAAMEGINILDNDQPELKEWYSGPALVDALDNVEVPTRPYDSPLRIPLSNVFKGQTAVASGVAVSGRLCSGVVQVGDRLRAVPGDEVANVRTIEVDEDSASYAVAGQNVTLYLSNIDPINLSIGTVLCPTSIPVPLVTKFTAQILVFDLQSPIIAGTPVELFHHSMNLPATISRLVSILEKGQVVRERPRVLQKGTTAMVELSLRPSSAGRISSIPLETATDNKEMGRVLIRRNGETIAAGMVMELLG